MDEGTLRGSFPPGALDDAPRLDRVTGAFVDDALERYFQRENFELNVRRYTRFSIPLALGGVLSYGLHDYLVVPEILGTAWLIRYAFFAPLAALTIVLVYRATTPARHQLAVVSFSLLASIQTLWIAAASSGSGYFLYTAYAIIYVTLGSFLARMTMRVQAIYTLLTIALYVIFEAVLTQHDIRFHFSYIAGLVTLGLIAVLSARQLEVQARLAFLQRRVIRDQLSALDIERNRSETLLLNVLPTEIARRLKADPDHIIADRFEAATILFSDIVGFTEMSARLDAETMVQRLDEVFSKFDAIAAELGLEKIKTIGDAYMVAGGIPAKRTDHVEAVCEMALRMRDIVNELAAKSDEPMRIRIGMHTGPVVAGVIGKKKFIYDVWGDSVNSASRMESHGVPGAIQVSAAVYEATKDTFAYEERGAIKVKGKGDMQTYLLVGRRDESKRDAFVVTVAAPESAASSAPEAPPELTFAEATFKDPLLERVFQKENFELNVRRYTRFSVPLAIIAFLSYGIHDYFLVPEIRNTAWLIRYAGFGPIALLVFLFVLRNKKFARHQPAMLVFGIAINTTVLAIAALAAQPGFFIYTSYAVIFLTLGAFLARMNVRVQAIYTIATLTIYLGFEAFLGHHDASLIFSHVMAISTLGVIGTLSARQLEAQARLAFHQRRVIRDQMAALDAERHRSETLLLNVLPVQIAARLKHAPEKVIADRFDAATVLFSDIVGFTEMSARLDAATMVQRLDEVFSRFDAIADSLGLEKIKTIGDAYMVAGGVPSRRSNHVELVCDMALQMRDVVNEIAAQTSEPMRVRIGMHTGPVVAGVIGKRKFIYDVWGDTVNSASRMESHGVPGSIQVSAAVYEATRHSFDYESRGTIAVKGKGEMQTYLLLGRRQEDGDRSASLPSELAGGDLSS